MVTHEFHDDKPPADFNEWPEEKRIALYELASNWHAMGTLGKWLTRFIMFAGGASAAVYYILSIYDHRS